MTIHSVAQYTEGLNAQGKHYVNEFAAFMHERFPELNQKISFAMPMWLVNTKMKEGYVAVSAAKNHFSIHFSETILEETDFCLFPPVLVRMSPFSSRAIMVHS